MAALLPTTNSAGQGKAEVGRSGGGAFLRRGGSLRVAPAIAFVAAAPSKLFPSNFFRPCVAVARTFIYVMMSRQTVAAAAAALVVLLTPLTTR